MSENAQTLQDVKTAQGFVEAATKHAEQFKTYSESLNQLAEGGAALNKAEQVVADLSGMAGKVASSLSFAGAAMGALLSVLGVKGKDDLILDGIKNIEGQIRGLEGHMDQHFERLKKFLLETTAEIVTHGALSQLKTLGEKMNSVWDAHKNGDSVLVEDTLGEFKDELRKTDISRDLNTIIEFVGKEKADSVLKIKYDKSYGDLREIAEAGQVLVHAAMIGVQAEIWKYAISEHERLDKLSEKKGDQLLVLYANNVGKHHSIIEKDYLSKFTDILEAYHGFMNDCVTNARENIRLIMRNPPRANFHEVHNVLLNEFNKRFPWLDIFVITCDHRPYWKASNDMGIPVAVSQSCFLDYFDIDMDGPLHCWVLCDSKKASNWDDLLIYSDSHDTLNHIIGTNFTSGNMPRGYGHADIFNDIITNSRYASIKNNTLYGWQGEGHGGDKIRWAHVATNNQPRVYNLFANGDWDRDAEGCMMVLVCR